MTDLRARIRAGERARGAMVFEFFSPGMARIMAAAGAEFVIWDMEHSGASMETMKIMAAASRGVVAPLARPPAHDHDWLSRLLDVGMKGLMIPMVDSAAQAAAVVEAVRYPPEGRRGAGFGFAHDDYAPGPPAETMARANAETLIIAQIETERGLAEVDAIAATDGIDALWIGQSDLSNFLGVPGRLDSPVYREAAAEIEAAARRHGKAMGAMAGTAAMAAEYAAAGYGMIAVGTDQALLKRAAAEAIEAAR